MCYVADLRSVILCGIESQACVQATVLDFLEKDYDVHIIADAVSSRSMVDRYNFNIFVSNIGCIDVTTGGVT